VESSIWKRSVWYLNGVKLTAASRGHAVVYDHPLDNSGADAGMTRPEFLARRRTAQGERFRAAKSSLIHNTLLNSAAIETVLCPAAADAVPAA
jgi:hypothetical protein